MSKTKSIEESSTEKISFVVKGEPISKSNATQVRWSRKLKRCEVFIPEEFETYEHLIRDAAIEYMNSNNKLAFLTGPVIMNIDYYLSTKRVKDLLNLPKTTCDALNNICYKDDSQIVQSTCNKYYDKLDPRVVITIYRPLNWEQNIKDNVWSIPQAYLEKPIALVSKVVKVKDVIKPKPKPKAAKSTRAKPAKQPNRGRKTLGSV